MKNSYSITQLKTVETEDGSEKLYELNIGRHQYPKWDKTYAVARFGLGKISFIFFGESNYNLFEENLGNCANLNRISKDFNSWNVEYIELKLDLPTIGNLNPNYMFVSFPFHGNIKNKEIMNYCTALSLLFVDAIMHESIQRKLRVRFGSILMSELYTGICVYLHESKLSFWFDNVINRPLPKSYKPKPNVFNEIFKLNNIFSD
jgi:hypothetical protein